MARPAFRTYRGYKDNSVNSIKTRLLRGSLWVSIARAGSNALSALSIIVLARILLPADFGLVALATSMLVIVQAFTDLSLNQALVHSKDPTRDHYNTVWSMSVTRGVIIGLFFALAGPIASHVYGEPNLQGVMAALGLSAALNGLVNPKITMLKKQLMFHQDAVLTIGTALTAMTVAVSVAVATESYWALVCGAIAGQLVNVILSYSFFPYRPALHWSKFGELWSFSLWVSLGQIVNTLNYRFDELLVGTFLGRKELGLYTVGGRLAKLPGQEIIRPLTATIFPAFRLTADDPLRLRRAYIRTQGLATAVALPTGIGFAMIAEPLVRLILGEKWLGAIVVVQLVAMVTSVETLGSLITPLGMAKGETRLLFVRNCQKLAIRVPLIITGLYFGGLMGLLYMRVTAGIVTVFIDMLQVKRLIKLSLAEQLRANWRCFTSTVLMAAAIHALSAALPRVNDMVTQGLTLAFIVALAAMVYVSASWLLWLAAGRPNGPETEVLDSATGIIGQLRKKA